MIVALNEIVRSSIFSLNWMNPITGGMWQYIKCGCSMNNIIIVTEHSETQQQDCAQPKPYSTSHSPLLLCQQDQIHSQHWSCQIFSAWAISFINSSSFRLQHFYAKPPWAEMGQNPGYTEKPPKSICYLPIIHPQSVGTTQTCITDKTLFLQYDSF